MTALPAPVARVLDTLEEAGFAAYVVGGCVRDGLRGLPPHDWDVCTAATPDEMHRVLAGFRLIDTGRKHGTVTVLSGRMPVETTTFRTEDAYSDGRRPDRVQFVRRIEQDLARRDFTVGAMAYSPRRGLCDPFGGRRDLAAHLLRCVGDPDARFAEDSLRVLRALRFAASDGFAIESGTDTALRRQAAGLRRISAERLREELLRLLCGRFAGPVLRTYPEVLAAFCPELAPMFGFQQHNAHHLYDVWEHTIRMLEQIPALPVLRMTALLHDSGKPASYTRDARGVGHFYGHAKESVVLAERLLARLRFPKEQAREILLLVEQHDRPLGDSPRLVRRRLARIGEDRFRQLLAVKKADCVGQGTHRENLGALLETEELLNTVLTEQACFTKAQLALGGRELMALGLRGPAIGRMQETLLEYVLENPADNNPTALRALVRRAMERNRI